MYRNNSRPELAWQNLQSQEPGSLQWTLRRSPRDTIKRHVFRCSAAEWPSTTISATTTLHLRAASHEFARLSAERSKQLRCCLRGARIPVVRHTFESTRRNEPFNIRTLLPGPGSIARAAQCSAYTDIEPTNSSITEGDILRQQAIHRQSDLRWNRRIFQPRRPRQAAQPSLTARLPRSTG